MTTETRLRAAQQTSGWKNVALGLFLFGGALFISATRELVLSAGSDQWPITTGTIVSSRLRYSGHHQDSPSITYRYVVDGQTYTAQRIHFFLITSTPISQRIVNRYPAGLVLDVRYNPAHPSMAILEPTPWIVGYVELFVSLALLVLGRRAYVRGKAQHG